MAEAAMANWTYSGTRRSAKRSLKDCSWEKE